MGVSARTLGLPKPPPLYGMLQRMSELQNSVDRYHRALTMPKRLVGLHPGRIGHSGNASAIAPAVVLMSISAFEGFVEDITAAAMHLQGHSYSYIARVVGNWTNPDLRDWGNALLKHFTIDISSGFRVKTTRGVQSGNWSTATLDYDAAADLASSWMNVRHALTHGGASARGAEQWPAATRSGEPISLALRPDRKNPEKYHLDLPGALGCAGLYAYGAQRGADLLASRLGHPVLRWNDLPKFDPRS